MTQVHDWLRFLNRLAAWRRLDNVPAPSPTLSAGQEITDDDIFYCFRLLLGRRPTAEERIAHKDVAQYTTLKNFVQSFLRSKEFLHGELSGKNPQPILKSYPDFCIYADPSDPFIGRGIVAGSYEPGVEALFRTFVQPGMTVLDIGANIGFFTLLTASLVGPSGKVIAFEPNANNVKLLEASRRENGFENICIHCLAASDAAGILAFDSSYTNGIANALSFDRKELFESTIIPASTVDTMIAIDQPIHFIKIDVEGSEYRALNGMKRILNRHRPIIVSEFYPEFLGKVSGATTEEYVRFFDERRYKIAVVEDDGRLTNCNDHDALMATFQHRGVNHIDLLLSPIK